MSEIKSERFETKDERNTIFGKLITSSVTSVTTTSTSLFSNEARHISSDARIDRRSPEQIAGELQVTLIQTINEPTPRYLWTFGHSALRRCDRSATFN